MSSRRCLLMVCALVGLVLSRQPMTAATTEVSSFVYDLRGSCDEWQAGFADYPQGEEKFYELKAKCSTDATNKQAGYLISGNNHSDDLFMFIKHSITGLRPSTVYKVEGNVKFWSRAPKGCAGVGGSPGESVWVKFGASQLEPKAVVDKSDYLRMNVDIGHQNNSGTNAVIIGNVATTITDCANTKFELKELETTSGITAKTDQNGVLWIFVGTDSGFEATTTVIYTEVSITVRL